jgi:hypothetical protein
VIKAAKARAGVLDDDDLLLTKQESEIIGAIKEYLDVLEVALVQTRIARAKWN